MTVLERLLHTLQAGGTHTIADLAGELQVTEALVEMMIEDLVRMGWLTPLAAGCDERCAACPVAARCAVGGAGRLWSLTEKT